MTAPFRGIVRITYPKAASFEESDAVFAPQNVSTPSRGIALYGECRDRSSTKDDTHPEEITLD